MKKKFWDFPWYAILFAVYPILTLLAHNIGQVEYSVAYRALFVSVLASVFSVFILYFILRDWKKAGILTVLWLLAFFFYGHVFGYIKGLEISGRVIGRHTYFMAVWLSLFLGIIWLTLKSSWQTALVPV